jgi:hypothetical protein
MTTLGLRGVWEGGSGKGGGGANRSIWHIISIKANCSIWHNVAIKANCFHLTQRSTGERSLDSRESVSHLVALLVAAGVVACGSLVMLRIGLSGSGPLFPALENHML